MERESQERNYLHQNCWWSCLWSIFLIITDAGETNHCAVPFWTIGPKLYKETSLANLTNKETGFFHDVCLGSWIQFFVFFFSLCVWGVIFIYLFFFHFTYSYFFFVVVFVFCLLVFWDGFSLCNCPSCPGNRSLEQVGLGLIEISLPLPPECVEIKVLCHHLPSIYSSLILHPDCCFPSIHSS